LAREVLIFVAEDCKDSVAGAVGTRVFEPDGVFFCPAAWDPKAVAKPFWAIREIARKRARAKLLGAIRGDFQMITLKIASVVFGVALLLLVLAPGFCADVALAAIACG
jgi:hypothetical protein